MPISLRILRKGTRNIECENGGKSLEIGSEGKALIEDQKEGNRGAPLPDTERRQGEKGAGQISIGPVTVHG